jgi:hypothetical protein
MDLTGNDRAKIINEHITISLHRIASSVDESLGPFSYFNEQRRLATEYFKSIKAGGQIDILLSYDLRLTPEESIEMFGE